MEFTIEFIPQKFYHFYTPKNFTIFIKIDALIQS